MNQELLFSLIHNAALLLALGLLYDVFQKSRAFVSTLGRLTFGLLIGGVGILLMMTSVHWGPGVYFDTRTILLGLSGLFFGVLPTLAALTVTIGYRVFLGGSGIFVGVLTLLAAGGIGLAWNRFRLRGGREPALTELYCFGLAVHVAMLLCLLFLPGDIRAVAFRELALPVLLLYPVCTALLGELLVRRRRRERVAAELAASEDLHRSILRTAIDGIWRADREGRLLEVNDAYCRMSGFSRAELLTMTIADVEVGQSPEEIEAQIHRIMDQAVSRFESRHRRKDGTSFDVEVSTQFLDFAGGQCVAFLRDITEHKRVERELQEARDLYAEAERIGKMGGWEFDLASRELKWTDEVYRIHEVDPASFVPTPEKVLAFYTPRSREIMEEAVRKAIETGVPHDVADLEIRTATGQRKTVHAISSVRSDKNKVVGFFQDVTDRKRVEEELNLFFDLVPDMVCIAATDGYFHKVNQEWERALGYSREELLAIPYADLIHPDDLPATQQEIRRQISGKRTLAFVNRYRARDGSYRWLEWRAAPAQSEPLLFAAARDVTERKQAEEERLALERQFQQAQRMESLGMLAGGIAHDFNNILMAILGNADLGLMRLPAGSPAEANLRQIESAARKAADLAGQMLAYSGKGRFVIEPLDLNQVIEEMTHILQVSITKGAILKVNGNRQIPAVEADATQLRQIVMNLVINASEAIGDNSGVIAVSTGAMDCDRNYLQGTVLDEDLNPGLYAFIEVADTGCGMDERTQRHLFDPFFSTKFAGRGLGMASVLGIVRGHRGAIRVDSRTGQGTTFRVLLPASDCRPAPGEAPAAEGDWQGSGTILLVDDEETVSAVGSEMLRELGFTVLVAGDGRQGVESYRQRQGEIAAVLLDLTMPHLNGDQALRELRRLNPNLPVIIASGYSEQEVSGRFAGERPSGFLQKPFTMSGLREALRVLEPAAGS